jgi:hypothetical protein
MTAVLVPSLCAVARKPSKYAFKVNVQTIRPPKNYGGRNGCLTGAAEVQRLSGVIDELEMLRQQGAFQHGSWDDFRDHGRLLGDLLRAKGLI